MRTHTLAIALIIWLSQPAIADDYIWSSRNITDDFSGESSVTVYRVGDYGFSGKHSVVVSLTCGNGQPNFEISFNRFINFASQPFELLVRVDDNDPIRMPMRTYSNSTEAGYTSDLGKIASLFVQMKAGTEMKWRTDTSSDRLQGSIGLNGFTGKSVEFANSCKLN